MRFIELFSGIGGFTLGLSAAGMEPIGFVEIDEYCQKLLNQNFPGLPIHGDIKTFGIEELAHMSTISYFTSKILMEDDMPMKRNKKYDQSVLMYERGLSIQDIADYYHITRQAMWMILKRRNVRFRDKLNYKEDNCFYRGGTRMDKRAQAMVEKAIKKGIIIPKLCEGCGSTAKFKDGRSAIQAHHDDYNKPLEIRWLCQTCHYNWHKENHAKKIKGEPRESAGTIDLVCGGFP